MYRLEHSLWFTEMIYYNFQYTVMDVSAKITPANEYQVTSQQTKIFKN